MAFYGQKYNQGGLDTPTSSAGAQLNDYAFSRFAVLEAAKKKVFSQLGAQRKQHKGFGKTIKKYREYPILHDANINDQGVDANGVKMVPGKWYAYDASGARIGEYDTLAEAKAAPNQVRVWKGDGNLYGSSRDFNVQTGAFPVLGEEGGNVNLVGTSRDIVTAKIQRYGFALKYTKAAMDFDTDRNLLMKEIQKVAEAYGDIREAQIRNGLITAGLTNAVYAGSATSMDTVDETCRVEFSDLRQLKLSLDAARCPVDTNMITGSTKIGTTTIKAARYIYVPQEVIPTLEDMTHNGKVVWQDVAEYADGGNVSNSIAESATNVGEGEVGRIGSFRFITVFDMPVFRGAGADATDGADNDGDGLEDSSAGFYVTDGKYDVFPMLVVGSDSFETYSLEGDVAKVKHGAPRVDPVNDPHGDIGSIAFAWYFGLMINTPEHLRVLLTSAVF
jgi:N4-gp56 family major capsid protein